MPGCRVHTVLMSWNAPAFPIPAARHDRGAAFLFRHHFNDRIDTMDDSQPKRDSEPEELCDIRKEIDLIDKQLLDLIVTRCDLAVSTLDVKRRNGLLATDARREGEVTSRSIVLAQERGLDTELVQGIFRRVIDLARAALKAAGGSGPLS